MSLAAPSLSSNSHRNTLGLFGSNGQNDDIPISISLLSSPRMQFMTVRLGSTIGLVYRIGQQFVEFKVDQTSDSEQDKQRLTIALQHCHVINDCSSCLPLSSDVC